MDPLSALAANGQKMSIKAMKSSRALNLSLKNCVPLSGTFHYVVWSLLVQDDAQKRENNGIAKVLRSPEMNLVVH